MFEAVQNALPPGLRSGQFLLLGSAALDLLRQRSDTLAGRVAYVDMAAITTAEAAAAGISDNTRWLRGGFPDSLLAADDPQSLDWRRDFIRSYLERDVPMFAPRLPAETIGRLWTMLAHNQGSVLNQARIATWCTRAMRVLRCATARRPLGCMN